MAWRLLAHSLVGLNSAQRKTNVKNNAKRRGNMFQKNMARSSLQQGMTLVEVMIVLVVIALMALFAAPDLISWKPRMALKRAGDTLFSDLQMAKTLAVKKNVDVEFTFTVAASPCPVAGGGSYKIEENVGGVKTTIVNKSFNEGVCLSSSTFAAGEGFTPRGLSIKGGGGVATVIHAKWGNAKKFDITQSVAGGVTID